MRKTIEVDLGGDSVRSYWIGPVPLPPGTAAMTLGRLVLVAPGVVLSGPLVRHESQHVRQYRTHGFFGFLVRYLRDYLALRRSGLQHDQAYRSIPFEIEATHAEHHDR